MTGSRRAFQYTADDQSDFGVIKDESAAEATFNGDELFDDYVSGTARLPCGLRKRYVNTVLSTDSNIRRRFEIGNPTVFENIVDGSEIVESAGGLANGGTYRVTLKVGERRQFLTTTDTAQIDGDGD